MLVYDVKHWEGLVDTIIDRIGVERFIDIVVYVLEERGCDLGVVEPIVEIARRSDGDDH